MSKYFKGGTGLHGESWNLARDYWAGEIDIQTFERKLVKCLLATEPSNLRKDYQSMAMMAADLKIGKIKEPEIRRELLLVLLMPKVY